MINFDKYPGAKTNSGIIQFLINRIPYHTRYFELYAGTAALFYAKKPAAIKNILTDADIRVIKKHWEKQNTICDAYCFKALDFIQSGRIQFSRSDFIYLDPPYPLEARRSGKKYYKYEMSDDDHVQLLSTGLQMDTNIMISTRQNDMYDEMLKGWRKESTTVTGRHGTVDEIIYMNYPPPVLLHQYDMIGADCWQRQGIKRKRERFQQKFAELPVYEQHIFIQQMIKQNPDAVMHFMQQRE